MLCRIKKKKRKQTKNISSEITSLCLHNSTEQQVHLHISCSIIIKAAADQAYLYYSHQNQNTAFLINQIMEKMGVAG